jgi:Tol biopolymer transport system component
MRPTFAMRPTVFVPSGTPLATMIEIATTAREDGLGLRRNSSFMAAERIVTRIARQRRAGLSPKAKQSRDLGRPQRAGAQLDLEGCILHGAAVMKFVLSLAVALLALGGRAGAQAVTPLPGVVPANVILTQAGVTADGQRIYGMTAAGEVWFFDRATRTSTQIAKIAGEAWYWNVAPGGHGVAYTKNDEDNKAEHVWMIPLDVRTGKPTGPERRVGLAPGDAPSISSNGRWMAFARDDSIGQTLMIAPLNGGPERAVASMDGGIGLIRWTPDDKWIYLTSRSITFRVSAEGGTPSRVAAGYWEPGLSPDGKVMVVRDTTANFRYIVTDTVGKRLTTFEVPESQAIWEWAGASSILVGTMNTVRRLHSYSIATGQSRILVDGLSRLVAPAVSPDGKRVSVVQQNSIHGHLIVANVDGSGIRRVPMAARFGVGSDWTADGRWVAYRVRLGSTAFGGMRALEVATGRDVALSPTSPSFPSNVAWLADSRRGVIVDMGDSTIGPAPTRQFIVKEVSVTGPPVVRRELTLPKDAFVWPIGEDEMLVRRGVGQATVVTTIKPGGPERVLLPAAPGWVSVPSFSADGQWIAFRRNPAQPNNSRLTVLEVMRRDGSNRITIPLPFAAQPGFASPHFLPGDQQLILGEDASQPNGGGVYLVTLADKSFKKLITLPYEGARNFQQYAVTPDGKTIFYLTTDRVPSSFGVMAVPTGRR